MARFRVLRGFCQSISLLAGIIDPARAAPQDDAPRALLAKCRPRPH
jgi:hypothetical protein